MSSQQQKQPILKKITKGLTVGTVITGSTFFHGPPVLALGFTKFFKKSKKSLILVSKRVIDLYKSLDSAMQKWPKEELVHAEQCLLGITASYYR